MTTHPIDTEALQDRMRRAVATAEEDGCGAYINPRDLTALLDLLAAAEHRATRAEAQSAIRGRAVVIYRDRARKAEAGRDEWRQTALDERGAALDALEQIKVRDARIKAVEDALSYADMGETLVTRSRIRRALDGDA